MTLEGEAHLPPWGRDPGDINVVQGIAEVIWHDDRPVNSQLKLAERYSHSVNHSLHTVDLLPQKDVQGFQVVHLLQQLFHLFEWNKSSDHQKFQLSVLRVNFSKFTAANKNENLLSVYWFHLLSIVGLIKRSVDTSSNSFIIYGEIKVQFLSRKAAISIRRKSFCKQAIIIDNLTAAA